MTAPEGAGAGAPDAAAGARIVASQPVGTLILDGEGVVRFGNPAAAELLGAPVGRLVGAAFGFPLAGDGVTDLNIPAHDGTVRTVAMRVTPLRWPDGRSALVSLFDVSGRTRRYEHEHRLVESLQRSLLPEQLPVLPGIELAASYEPAASDVRIGGDWYDAIPLGGRLGLAIGDVAGHGIESAALMGRLRNALRAYAIDDPAPARVLARLGHLVYELERRSMATVTYLVYDPAARRLEFASAGHPYPLLVRPDGAPEFLRGGRSSALGAGDGMRRLSDGLHVPAGSVLVLYTDGLIERRTRSLDDGMAALAATATGLPRDARGACRTLLGNLVEGEGVDDDVAVLVMRTA